MRRTNEIKQVSDEEPVWVACRDDGRAAGTV
jgi:hypothetical protein